MEKDKRENLKKKDISKNIYLKTGIPSSYASKFLDDIISILISGIKRDRILKIGKFGSFSLFSKNKRIGRNPKNNEEHEISERKIVSFKASSYLKNKINKNV